MWAEFHPALSAPWSGPTFWSPQHNHGPANPLSNSSLACFLPMLADFADTVFRASCHCLVHALGIRAFHKIRCPTVASEETVQLIAADAGEECRIIDFVAVQV